MMAGSKSPKNPPRNPLADLVTSHESRIQHLEQQHVELSSQVTAVESQVKFTGEMLSDKLDGLGQQMSEHVLETRERTTKILARVETLETAKVTSAIADAVRASLAKKFLLPVVALGGGILTKLGEWLMALLTGP